MKKVITFEFCKEDIITLDNLESEDRPEMMKNELDLEFEIFDGEVDKDVYGQIRVNWEKDWGKMDWK